MSLVLNVEILGEFKNLTKATQGAQTQLSGMNQKIGSFSKFAKSAFASIGVGLSFALIARELTEATKAAVEDEKSQALLAQQLVNTTKATKSQIASVEQQIGKLQLSASITDDKLRPAFAQFTRVTGETTKAMDLLNLATEVSAGSGKSLEVVTSALSKAYGGKMAALVKLGIPMSDSIQNASDYSKEMTKLNKLQTEAANTTGPEHVKAMEKVAAQQAKVNAIAEAGIDWQGDLAKAFAGSAATASKADAYQRLTVVMGELQESVGVVLLPVLEKFATWLVTVTPQIQAFFKELMDPTKPMGKAWAELGLSFLAFGKTLNGVFAGGKTDANGFITVLKILKSTLDAVVTTIDILTLKGYKDFMSDAGKNVGEAIGTRPKTTTAPVGTKSNPATSLKSLPAVNSSSSKSGTTNVNINVSQAVTAKTIIDTVSAYQKSTGTSLSQALR